MFISTFIYLIFLRFCTSKIEIKDAGIASIEDGDIAIIFYVTIENVCEKDLEITVHMVQCCEMMNSNENDCSSMFLIGGYMGLLYTKYIKNVTLIYPNLYLYGRHGTCTVAINYQNEDGLKTVTKEIEFKTNDTTFEKNQCSSIDLDPEQNCYPVDCVIKYSGDKSFFNPNYMECDSVPSCITDPNKCMPEIAYSPVNNNCTNLNCSITKHDLELLENNQADVYEMDNVIPGRIVCHHGEIDSNGQCHCSPDWATTFEAEQEEEPYEPTLMQYHMCNVEKGAWNCVNRNKMKTTGLIIAIFALTVVSKIIIIMCVLSFCYKHFKSSTSAKDKVCTDKFDDFDESLILCENQLIPQGKCICEDLPKRQLQTETVNVSYFVAKPSIGSINRKSHRDIEGKSIKKSTTSDRASSQTTSSSVPISFQTETDDYSSEESSCSAEDDYEIDFTGEEEVVGEEQCYCQPEQESNLAMMDQSAGRPSLAKVMSKKSSSHHSKSSKIKKSHVTLPDDIGG